MLKKILSHAPVIAFVALSSAAGPALANVTAGGAYHAATGGDAPFIFHASGAVSNSDTVAARTVTAGEPFVINGPGTVTRKVFAVGNGGALTCTLFARHLSSGNAVSSSNTLFVTFPTFLTIGMNLNFSGPHTISVVCSIPKVVSGAGTYVFGSSP